MTSQLRVSLMTLDPGADISDVYAFTSYDAANLARPAAERKVTLIMNVVPSQEPSSGPNYFNFDPGVVYSFHLDNDRDGKADDVSFDNGRFEILVEPAPARAPGLVPVHG